MKSAIKILFSVIFSIGYASANATNIFYKPIGLERIFYLTDQHNKNCQGDWFVSFLERKDKVAEIVRDSCWLSATTLYVVTIKFVDTGETVLLSHIAAVPNTDNERNAFFRAEAAKLSKRTKAEQDELQLKWKSANPHP